MWNKRQACEANVYSATRSLISLKKGLRRNNPVRRLKQHIQNLLRPPLSQQAIIQLLRLSHDAIALVPQQHQIRGKVVGVRL